MVIKFSELKLGDYFVDARVDGYPVVYQKKSLSTAHPLICGKKGALIQDVESVPPEVISKGASVYKITL